MNGDIHDDTAPDSGEKEPPRFMVALQQYEEFLNAKAKEVSPEDREQSYQYFRGVMSACNGLVGVAQTFDFASTHPELADTNARDSAGREMARLLASPDIPVEIRDIYGSLYGDDIRQYESSGEM